MPTDPARLHGSRVAEFPANDVSRSPYDRVLDGVIEDPTGAARYRNLLTAVDWRQVTRRRVDMLLERMSDAGVQAPSWLLRSLVLGGHGHLAVDANALSPELRALSDLNALAKGEPIPLALEHILTDSAANPALEPVIANALCRRLVDLGHISLACAIALGQWPHSQDPLRAVRKPLADVVSSLPALTVQILGFSTMHAFGEYLATSMAAHGRRAIVREAPFGTALSALLDPVDGADATVLLLDQDGVFAVDWRNDLARVSEALDARLAALEAAISGFGRKCSAPLLVNTLPTAVGPYLGHLDRSHAAGAAFLVDRVNRRLAEIAALSASVHLVDADVALAAIAPLRRRDAKLWYYGRIAFSDEATRALAHSFAVSWRASERASAKVLAIDFDNTLWGGVYGDDGIDRLACGDDFPGNAYKAFQQECLRLKAQGMLLVGLSKNNTDALDVFDRHPGMALRRDDLTATAVNWQPKPENIKRLAKELNLGLDSFVFVDDSPHEREAMRRMCPSVLVPEMPADPADRPQWLRSLAATWPLRLTAEDTQRAAMYAAEQRARSLRETATSYEDYLTELEQRLIVEPLSPRTLARVAQLHQRTNQFNLTTRRFTEADLTAFMQDAGRAQVFLGTVADKFGDHGIVVAAVATLDGNSATIESFLMSCRVMSRQIETAFLSALVERLAAQGVERIEASYIPSAKNAMVKEFYPSHGFVAPDSTGEPARWSWAKGLDLRGSHYVTVQWRMT